MAVCHEFCVMLTDQAYTPASQYWFTFNISQENFV